ncbi:MAG: DUF1416 domain-containing protein [Pseudonocardiales bacterium]|nr:DUF1416 domain-containing protein [Pseudonocardiales bacterium]MBV9032147.1 DUF1416 domain-containing protein [Pseudonocardiales bacterium]MBW0010434.1 DUF1416 domain-containing protein [Pseudonocardiales bacterium]
MCGAPDQTQSGAPDQNQCGAPDQNQELPPGTDLSKHTVLTGTVRTAGEPSGGSPVGGAFVRLLDGTGEFTAEVVSSASGQFRFFAAPGPWTIRALHRSGTGERPVTADAPGLFSVDVTVS